MPVRHRGCNRRKRRLNMHILVINCGSSSVKYRLFDMANERVMASGLIERIGQPGAVPNCDAAMAQVCAEVAHCAGHVAAVGHRVVHGGEQFGDAARISPDVEAAIDGLAAFAPLHNPPNLTGIRAARAHFPDAVHVAVFDTAFHQTAQPRAFLYALPYTLYERDRIRRYGFHGTSHRYVSERAAGILGRSFTGITCHLGNGCSIAAIERGCSVDTSMGFTPLEGVPMGTRSGDVDPAVVLMLARRLGADETERLLNRESGLLGLSELSNDVRELQQAADAGHARAELALEVFAYRIRKYIGAYLAALGRADAIVFTGGIGENSADIRRRILEGLEGLGICLDVERNAECTGREVRISTDDSRISILVIPTDEERLIARQTHRVVRGD